MDRSGRPIGIDLFCGVGGMTLGFEQAGFDVLAALDFELLNVEVHQKNFPLCKALCINLSDASGDQIRRAAGLGERTIDVVFGGPPCQGFSLIGRRLKDDARNFLFLEMARLIGELSPSYFVVENVGGIQVGHARTFLSQFVERVADSGYQVVEPMQILNAAEFGVPQKRRRLFIMGCKQGLIAPAYPEPIYPAGNNGDYDGPTVWDAISDLPRVNSYKYLLSSDRYSGTLGEPSYYAKILRGECPDPNDLSYYRDRKNRTLTGCKRTEHTPKTVRRFMRTKQGEYESVSRLRRLAKNGLAHTLRAGTGPAQGSYMAPRPIHPFQDRCITVREAARLHSFPDWFDFHDTKWHSFRQIGNAVPPRLARAVAQSIRQALKND